MRSLLEVREYKSPDSGDAFLITISSDTIYVRSPLPAPLREGADPLWPHPYDDDRRSAAGRGLISVIIKQSLLDTTSGSVLYRRVIDYSTTAGSRDQQVPSS
jgi:hypothetical protein